MKPIEHASGRPGTCTPCPIESCTWHLDEPAPVWDLPEFVEPDTEALARYGGDYLQATVFATVRAECMATEEVLRAHLETHALVEWVQEVTHLQRLPAGRGNSALIAGPPRTWAGPDGTVYDLGAEHVDRYGRHWWCEHWIHDFGAPDPVPWMVSGIGGDLSHMSLPDIVDSFGTLTAQSMDTPRWPR